MKMSLQSSRKGNPEIRISMDFDKLLFDGGIMRGDTEDQAERGTRSRGTLIEMNFSEASGSFVV
jgi:hypothetical protein